MEVLFYAVRLAKKKLAVPALPHYQVDAFFGTD
jgi:hypothetical protein